MSTKKRTIDVIIDDNIKIQIKCGQKQPTYRNGKLYNYSYKFAFRSTKYKDKHHSYPKNLDRIDYAICWAIDDDEFYIIPASEIQGNASVTFTSDEDKRTQVKWNKWNIYLNAWGLLKGEKIEDNRPTKEIECKQCGYKWKPSTPNPTRCPKCNSRWDKVFYDHTCKRCGHTFHSKIEHPQKCAKCHSYVWDKEKEPIIDRPPITCIQCGHTWKPTVENPKRCYYCHKRKFADNFKRTCKQCGYKWETTVGLSSKCPSCFSKDWDKEKTKELAIV